MKIENIHLSGDFMDDIFTEIELLPVCNCGHIIENLYAEEEVVGELGRLHKTINFVPSQCPNCGKFFKSMKWSKRIIAEV